MGSPPSRLGLGDDHLEASFFKFPNELWVSACIGDEPPDLVYAAYSCECLLSQLCRVQHGHHLRCVIHDGLGYRRLALVVTAKTVTNAEGIAANDGEIDGNS